MAAIVFGQLTHVVPCRYPVEARVERVVQKGTKLHLAVTHDIWVGRDTALVAVDQVVDHVLSVFVDQIDDFVVNSEMRGHRAGVFYILLRRAIG